MIAMDELIKLAVNSSGALAVAFLSFYYMDRKDKMFSSTVQEYLRESIKVSENLAKRMQEFTGASQELKEVTKEQSIIIKKMYDELVKKRAIITSYEIEKARRDELTKHYEARV